MICLLWLVALVSLCWLPARAAGNPLSESQTGGWLEVTADAGWPGDTIEVRIDHARYGDLSRVLGIQVDLWFPEGVRPLHLYHGQPDCGLSDGFAVYLDDVSDAYRFRSAFLPEDCDPYANCSGVRLVAAAEWHLDGSLQLFCRARIDDGVPPGSYPLEVENFYLAAKPAAQSLQMSSSAVQVLGTTPPPTPTSSDGATIVEPAPSLRLRSVPIATEYGDIIEVQFYLEGSAVAPLHGELVATIDAEHPLRPVVVDQVLAGCGRDWGLSRDARFELLPAGCAADERCRTVIASIELDAGPVGFDSGHQPNWYFRPDAPLFHCDFYFDSESFDVGYAIRLREVSFQGQTVATEDIVVAAPTPTETATATVTATLTPTPLYPARRCEATAGVAMICVEDIEADAGDEIAIAVRFRSGGTRHAGVEFVIEAADPLAFVGGTRTGDVGLVTSGCWRNVEIGRESTAAALRDQSLKVVVLSFVDLSPFPDDVHLLECAVRIHPSAAPGEYEIHLGDAGGSTPDGEELPLDVRSGVIRVRGAAVPTPTPAPPADPSLTVPQSPSTPEHDSRQLGDPGATSSGCQINRSQASDWQGILVALTGSLIWLRRRCLTPAGSRAGGGGAESISSPPLGAPDEVSSRLRPPLRHQAIRLDSSHRR